jgi:hypothetical protein
MTIKEVHRKLCHFTKNVRYARCDEGWVFEHTKGYSFKDDFYECFGETISSKNGREALDSLTWKIHERKVKHID